MRLMGWKPLKFSSLSSWLILLQAESCVALDVLWNKFCYWDMLDPVMGSRSCTHPLYTQSNISGNVDSTPSNLTSKMVGKTESSSSYDDEEEEEPVNPTPIPANMQKKKEDQWLLFPCGQCTCTTKASTRVRFPSQGCLYEVAFLEEESANSKG